MFIVFIAIITILTLLLPVLAPRAARHYHLAVQAAPAWLPILAAIVYFSAGFLPDIGISAETNSFQEHFIGGGVYTTALFVYFSKLIGWHPAWPIRFIALFAWASSLGVINELFEFALVKFNITHINISDTSWDLVANTTGMVVSFIIWRIYALVAKKG